MMSLITRIFKRWCHSVALGSPYLFSTITAGNLRHLNAYERRKFLTTLSPLASAFNGRPNRRNKLSLHNSNMGLFLEPELQEYTGFYALREIVEEDVDKYVKEATSPTRDRKLVEIFDDLSDCLCRVADLADFVRVSHPDADFATAADDTCVKLSGLVEKMNTNTAIHQALKNVLENGDVVDTDSLDRNVAERFMFDFNQSGIHLPEETREAFVKLNEKILQLGSLFMQGTEAKKTIKKDKLPQKIQHCFNQEGDNIFVTGLYSEHFNNLVREAAYRIYLFPDIQQQQILQSLLTCRQELARLVGYDTFSHRALKGTLAETPENVSYFLETLADRIKERAAEDYAYVLQMKKADGIHEDIVMPWDPPYYTALARQKQCDIDIDELSAYFSVGNCMEGLNNLFRCLYDVTLQHVQVENGEVWAEDVNKIAVVHKEDGVLGYIYCDFFDRVGKSSQDSHYTIRGGRQKSDGTYQLPVAVLQLSFPSPSGTTPSLLSPGMVENLFHEFGHAMHSVLGRTKYQHVTGTRCPTDFAEVPAMLMEYFATDPRVLSTFAFHYKSGDAIPSDWLHNLCRSKKMFAASDLQLQVFYSLVDHMYHSNYTLEKSTTEIMADIQNKYHGIPYVSGTAWQLRFGHLVGYGAKYYSYLMSRAVASRIWHTCFKDDPFNRDMGERYRHEMLAHGGGVHPADLIRGFLREEPDTSKFIDSILEDLGQSL